MMHFGKTPEGEFELRIPADDMPDFYRAISDGTLVERRNMYHLKTFMETEFKDFIKDRK
jgi:hypothetical protein